jgi:nitroreductase
MNTAQPTRHSEDAEGFPRAGTAVEIWEFVLGYAVRAPSGHNTQPWRYRIAD